MLDTATHSPPQFLRTSFSTPVFQVPTFLSRLSLTCLGFHLNAVFLYFVRLASDPPPPIRLIFFSRSLNPPPPTFALGQAKRRPASRGTLCLILSISPSSTSSPGAYLRCICRRFKRTPSFVRRVGTETPCEHHCYARIFSLVFNAGCFDTVRFALT